MIGWAIPNFYIKHWFLVDKLKYNKKERNKPLQHRYKQMTGSCPQWVHSIFMDVTFIFRNKFARHSSLFIRWHNRLKYYKIFKNIKWLQRRTILSNYLVKQCSKLFHIQLRWFFFERKFPGERILVLLQGGQDPQYALLVSWYLILCKISHELDYNLWEETCENHIIVDPSLIHLWSIVDDPSLICMCPYVSKRAFTRHKQVSVQNDDDLHRILSSGQSEDEISLCCGTLLLHTPTDCRPDLLRYFVVLFRKRGAMTRTGFIEENCH